MNHRFGLDDGIFIKANHAALAGGVGTATKSTREKIGHLHRIEVEVGSERELKDAIDNGADAIVIAVVEVPAAIDLIRKAREASLTVGIVVSGGVTLENVRALGEAGADLVRVNALTQSVRNMEISFQIQPG